MIVKLLILILLSFVESVTDLPSTVIMEDLMNAIDRNELILPGNKAHFIYDQGNYIKEGSGNMEYLYQKQETLYVNFNIYNYIFLVDYIDENLEGLESCAKKINNQLSRKLNSDSSKSLIILFSMSSKRIRIQPGNSLDSKYSTSVSNQMINNLGTYMRSSDYYGAMEKLIEDIEYYYNKGSSSSDISTVGTIFIIIGIIIGCVVICYLYKKCGCDQVSSSSSLFDSSYHTHEHHHHHHTSHKSSGRSGGHRSGGRSGGGGGGGGASGGW